MICTKLWYVLQRFRYVFVCKYVRGSSMCGLKILQQCFHMFKLNETQNRSHVNIVSISLPYLSFQVC